MLETRKMVIEIIMDLLIIADLGGVSKDKEKEDKMRSDLSRRTDEELDNIYKKSDDLVKLIFKNEQTDRLLKEIDTIGIEAIREKYGLIKVEEDSNE